MSNLTDYVVEQAVNVLSIDSPTGLPPGRRTM